MHPYLDQIIQKKKEEIQNLYTHKKDLISNTKNTSPKNYFLNAFHEKPFNLIAEIKRASPSKGIIRHEFNPQKLALTFQNMDATALSVLTEKHFFKGDPAYIQQIKKICPLPILRKDFIIDPIQIYESATLKADAILLIKALLSKNQCQEFINLAKELGLDVLLEIHSEEELHSLKEITPIPIIGINNRNLKTFETDIKIAPKLILKIKELFPNALVIAESGYQESTQIKALAEQGFSGVLIGEGLAINPFLWES